MGCCCTDGIAEYNLANDSSPSHEGAAQVTRVQPESARAQPNLHLLHCAAPLHCAITTITATAVLPMLPISAAHCRCTIATVIAVPLLLLLPLPRDVPYFAAASTAAAAYFLLQRQRQPSHKGAASQRLQGRSSSHDGAAQVTRAQPKSAREHPKPCPAAV
jgi:hypothetical protein